MNECSCETPRPRHAGVHPTVCQYCNLIIEAESFSAENKCCNSCPNISNQPIVVNCDECDGDICADCEGETICSICMQNVCHSCSGSPHKQCAKWANGDDNRTEQEIQAGLLGRAESFSASGGGDLTYEGGRMVSIEEVTIVDYNWHTDPDETDDIDESDIESQVQEKVENEMYEGDSGNDSWSYGTDSDGTNVEVYI